jgi:rubredoxin
MLATEEVLLPMVPAAAMQDCRTLLEQAILEVVEAEFRRPDAHKGIDRLADWILNGRDERGAPVTIVSTNYDTLIEALLFERLEMAALEVPVAVDMGFFWREHRSGTFHEAVNQPPPDPMVRLLKLHGSLNWLKCPLCGFVYINTTGSIHQQAFREGHVDYNNTCLCGHGPVRTVIVAPSMVRTIRDPDLLTIWRTALEALRTADEWILAGYSLPPEDIAIRSILLRARNGRGRQGAPPTIRVVQYKRDPGLEGRYRLLLPESIFEWDGFQAFVEGLPRGTRHFPTF